MPSPEIASLWNTRTKYRHHQHSRYHPLPIRTTHANYQTLPRVAVDKSKRTATAAIARRSRTPTKNHTYQSPLQRDHRTRPIIHPSTPTRTTTTSNTSTTTTTPFPPHLNRTTPKHPTPPPTYSCQSYSNQHRLASKQLRKTIPDPARHLGRRRQRPRTPRDTIISAPNTPHAHDKKRPRRVQGSPLLQQGRRRLPVLPGVVSRGGGIESTALPADAVRDGTVWGLGEFAFVGGCGYASCFVE